MQEAKKNSGVLIEVAAQHPLKAGEFPGEEFAKRLDAALEFYQKNVGSGERIKFYIPGSRHSYNGVADKVSLAKAGTEYLIAKGIKPEDIYGGAENLKYKGEAGVYNSSDECYVATELFEDNNFGKIVVFCSPAQLMRKALSFAVRDYAGYVLCTCGAYVP